MLNTLDARQMVPGAKGRCCSRLRVIVATLACIAGLASGAGLSVNDNLTSTAHSCDYLIVAHDSLISAALSLAEYRLRNLADLVNMPLVVSRSQIDAQFRSSGDAKNRLKQFLRFAIQQWQYGPHRVLLMGDGALDTGLYADVSMIPTLQCSLAVSDDWLVTFDSVPAAAIGRIPARTTKEAQLVVDKIVRFEGTFCSDRQDVCVVTDDDRIGDSSVCRYSPFYALGESSLNNCPSYFRKVKLHSISCPLAVNSATKPDLEKAILDEMNANPLLMCFYGHASRCEVWTHEHILTVDSIVPRLRPGSLFVLGTYTCQNTAFQFPTHCIGEKLLLTPDAGAVAAFGTTGGKAGDYNDYLSNAIMRGLSEQSTDIGTLVWKSKVAYYTPGMEEVVLLGDPAMMVRQGGAIACPVQLDCDAAAAVTQIRFRTPVSIDGLAQIRVLGAADRIRGTTECGLQFDYVPTLPILRRDTVRVEDGNGVYRLQPDSSIRSSDTVTALISVADSNGWYIGSTTVLVGGEHGAAGRGRAAKAASDGRARVEVRLTPGPRIHGRGGEVIQLSGRILSDDHHPLVQGTSGRATDRRLPAECLVWRPSVHH